MSSPHMTVHATDKFARRSGQPNLKPHETRRHMEWLYEQGEEGTRVNGDGVAQPVVRSHGWIFVLSHDREAVVTVFYNEAK